MKPIRGWEPSLYQLMPLAEVMEALHAGEFKPNCGLIIVDFLVRHGLVTPENEPSFFDISWRSHRRLGVAMPN